MNEKEISFVRIEKEPLARIVEIDKTAYKAEIERRIKERQEEIRKEMSDGDSKTTV